MNNACSQYPKISAIVLAAGLSKRMRSPKPLLSWGGTTVIRRIVDTLFAASVGEVIVVCGQIVAEIGEALHGSGAKLVQNSDYARGEMIQSVQLGLKKAKHDSEAALICLGDQPMMQLSTVVSVLNRYSTDPAGIVFPSYHQRRGHPWLVARDRWQAIWDLEAGQTLRDFLFQQRQLIEYVDVDTETILADMDTPEDYLRWLTWLKEQKDR